MQGHLFPTEPIGALWCKLHYPGATPNATPIGLALVLDMNFDVTSVGYFDVCLQWNDHWGNQAVRALKPNGARNQKRRCEAQAVHNTASRRPNVNAPTDNSRIY